MEIFLLLLDEIDDLVAMAGALWRPIAGFLAALALFVGTGFVFYNVPLLAEGLALLFVTLGVIDTFRERRTVMVESTASIYSNRRAIR